MIKQITWKTYARDDAARVYFFAKKVNFVANNKAMSIIDVKCATETCIGLATHIYAESTRKYVPKLCAECATSHRFQPVAWRKCATCANVEYINLMSGQCPRCVARTRIPEYTFDLIKFHTILCGRGILAGFINCGPWLPCLLRQGEECAICVELHAKLDDGPGLAEPFACAGLEQIRELHARLGGKKMWYIRTNDCPYHDAQGTTRDPMWIERINRTIDYVEALERTALGMRTPLTIAFLFFDGFNGEAEIHEVF